MPGQRNSRVLAIVWIVGALLGIASVAFLGYYGWAALLVWAIIVAPLVPATLRRIFGSDSRAGRHCALRAISVWAALLLLSVAFNYPQPRIPFLPPAAYEDSALIWVALAAIWVLAFGQLVFVLYATTWTVRRLWQFAGPR